MNGKRTFTTREDAFPCSYTRRAEPTSGNVDMRETNAAAAAGGLGVAAAAAAVGDSWDDDDDEGEEVEAYEVVVAERAGGIREPITLISR